MNVWRHIPTIFKQRHVLRIAGILSLCIALITTLLFASVSRAAPGINQTLSFQGRLLNNTGGVVPDGHYNIQFKIYQDGTGTTAGNPGGSLEWTESYINNGGSNGVEVTNGYFSVNLGSANPFGTQVDWNQDTLWLSMNVAGSATNCTSFGSAPCTADGEMLTMKRITSTPFALNSGMVGGKTAENLVQLAQGVQTDASNNTSSIFLNKTGTSGNFMQLQNAGVDVLTVEDTGDLTFGNSSNKTISIATAAADEDGKRLRIFAGDGGSGDGSTGGNLQLQGGWAGGTNGDGGNVNIDAGSGTGSGTDGYISIGASHTSSVIIGSNHLALSQEIQIGSNNTVGSSTNVYIGSGGNATSGNTVIQSKDDTTISTNGEQRARFSSSGNTLYVGNADADGEATTASSFTIQGTSSTGNNTQGGGITLQAGAATSGNANGGNITLSGGVGSGSGATGLVVINTPTFQTAGTQTCGSNCTVTQANLDSNGVVSINATAANLTVTLNDPTITTAGRIVYVTSAASSEDFTLSLNGGGAGNQVAMRANTATTLIWSGSDWVTAGGSNSTSLQNAYNNTPQSASGAELILNNGSTTDGLTIRDSSTNPVSGTLLEIQTSSAANLFSVNSATEYASNGGAETAGSSSTTFPANTWYTANATVTRHATAGNYIATGNGSVKVVSNTQYGGGVNKLNTTLAPNATYNVALSVRLESGSFTDLGIVYLGDGSTPSDACTTTASATTTEWTRINCTFDTPASGITADNAISIGQMTASGAHTYYIDNLSVTAAAGAAPNVQVGGGQTGGQTTLFTVDKSAAAPFEADEDLLGSMYYDTTLGKLQCYEADGWGACGSAPDNFITLSPEYANAVMNGTDIGTISSDLCSDTLNINDANNGEAVCGEDETFNFYKWTSSEDDAQTRSIYVTYQLPSTFKKFVEGHTSLMGRTNDAKSNVSYQIYRDNTGDGLTSCGSAITVSTGAKTTWQKATATGSADPFNCGFEPGDSILFRINLTAEEDFKAYVSNLNFTFSNN